jgi:hypothetical protein
MSTANRHCTNTLHATPANKLPYASKHAAPVLTGSKPHAAQLNAVTDIFIILTSATSTRLKL